MAAVVPRPLHRPDGRAVSHLPDRDAHQSYFALREWLRAAAAMPLMAFESDSCPRRMTRVHCGCDEVCRRWRGEYGPLLRSAFIR